MIVSAVVSSFISAALVWAVRRDQYSAGDTQAVRFRLSAHEFIPGCVFGLTPLIAYGLGPAAPSAAAASTGLLLLLGGAAIFALAGVCSLCVVRIYGATGTVLAATALLYALFAISGFGAIAAATGSTDVFETHIVQALAAVTGASLGMHWLAFSGAASDRSVLRPLAAGALVGVAMTAGMPEAAFSGDAAARAAISPGVIGWLAVAAAAFLLTMTHRVLAPAHPAQTKEPSLDLLDALPPAVAAIRVDEKGGVVAATAAARRLLGESSDRTAEEPVMLPASLAGVLQDAVRSEQTEPGLCDFTDHAGVARRARLHVARLPKKDGALVLFDSADELAKCEAALRRNAAISRAFLDANEDITLFMTGGGLIADINRAALRFLKKTRSQCAGEHIWSLFPPNPNSPSAQHWRGAIAAAVAQGTAAGDAVLTGADGERLFRYSVAKYGDPSEGAPSLLLCARDVTDIARMQAAFKKAQARLEQTIAERTRELTDAKKTADEASTAKSRFLANMSHELRTPLNAILGYTDLLMQDLKDEGNAVSQTYRDLDRVRVNGKHLLALINDVLDLAKVEANKMSVSCMTVDMPAFLDELRASIDPLVARNANTLSIDCDAQLSALLIDRQKVMQCLLNLLSNAAKFTEKGKIVLRVAAANGDAGRLIVFEVSDTGRGMTDAQCETIFDEFVQARDEDQQKAGGTGLGLPIARRFAQLMGGDLTARSKAGAGSVFTLTIREARAGLRAGEAAA